MKKHLYILAVAALVLNACGPTYVVQQPGPPPPSAEPLPPPPPESEPEATSQSFYDDLSPYGQWINDPNYGYVWLPDAGPDFKPYSTNGHWVYTDEGWTWASDYPWGWAAFHYGRWFFQDGYGWLWVPGNDYAPAWVTWRNSDDYYGWAPMGPGISFDMAYGGAYAPPAHYWSFVPHQYVGSPQVRNYYVNESRNVTIINRTTVINHITVVNNNVRTRNVNYGRGPDPVEVGRYTGGSVRPVPVRTSTRPVPGGQTNNGGLSVYRPRINDAPRNNNGNTGAPPRLAPNRVSNLNEARPQNTAVYGTRPANAGFPNRDNNPVNNQPQRPANNPPAVQRPPVQQPPVQRPPVQQPPVQQPPVQQPPVQQPPVQQQPAGQPATTPVRRPSFPSNGQLQQTPSRGQTLPQQPAAQPGGRPAQQPVAQPPASQPVNNHPVTQPPARPTVQPQQHPVNQPAANRPVFTPRPQSQPTHAPAAQPKPVSRPVTPPPPQPKPEEKKDSRPVRQ